MVFFIDFWEEIMTMFRKFNPYMHNVVKWPDKMVLTPQEF